MPALRFFDDRTLETFRAVAACVVPSEEGAPGADYGPFVALADRSLADRPEHDRKLLRAFLRALEWLPLLRYGRRFSRLDLARRTAFLTLLERNRLIGKLRAGVFGLKTYALLGYYGSDASFQEIGYPGPRLDAPYYALRARDRGR